MALWLYIPSRASHRGARLFLYVVAAYLCQDPLRKMLPGAPVYLQLAFVAPVVYIYLVGTEAPRAPFPEWAVLGLSVSLQPLFLTALLGFTYHDFDQTSPAVALLGFFTYFFFVPVLFHAQRVFRDERAVVEFMEGFVLLVSIAVVGVWLEAFFGPQITQGIGYTGHLYDTKSWVWASRGIRLSMCCGFFQSAGPMVFTLSIAFAYCLALAVSGRSRGKYVALAVLLFATSLLGVRRKCLFVFGGALIAHARHAVVGASSPSRRTASALFVLLIIVVLAVVAALRFAPTQSSYYYARFVVHSSEDFSQRLEDMTEGDIKRTTERIGAWGAGTGMGACGAHHFARMHWTNEGGFAWIYGELGLAGLVTVCIAVVGVAWVTCTSREFLRSGLKIAAWTSLIGLGFGAFGAFVISSGVFKLYFCIFSIWLNLGMILGMAEDDRLQPVPADGA